MSWHFEDLRAHKHQGGLLFNYISIGMVFYFCFLKGRSIALGRERARCTAMNHSILFPLINDPNSAIKQKQKMTCKNCVDDIKENKSKKTTFLSRTCVPIMMQTLFTIWQNHSSKNIYCFLSTKPFLVTMS